MASREQEHRDKLLKEIAALMGPLVRALRGALRDCAEELRLAQSEANVLLLLAAPGEVTTKELAQRLEMDPANASTLLTRLEGRGLLRREPARADRRKRVVSLTRAGNQTRARLENCVGERRPSFRALSANELIAFRDLLRRVVAEGEVGRHHA
ncbi:MAG TPA: MarR family transcriptional regulator [Solirubrobacterales bacterium]